MPKLVCVKCQVELRPEKNGTYVVEMARSSDGHINDQWPYRLWSADTWKCLGCMIEVVSGFAQYPVMEHSDPGFMGEIERLSKDPYEKVVYDYERLER